MARVYGSNNGCRNTIVNIVIKFFRANSKKVKNKIKVSFLWPYRLIVSKEFEETIEEINTHPQI